MGQRQGAQLCGGAGRTQPQQPAAAAGRRQDALADCGVVVRCAVSGRTGAVAVVGLVAGRRQDPVVPADLAERDPQSPAAAACLVVAGRADRIGGARRRRQRNVREH